MGVCLKGIHFEGGLFGKLEGDGRKLYLSSRKYQEWC
jgi:hypothetical protein